MQITHKMTATINKGRMSVFSIIDLDGTETAIAVMPSKISKCVTESDLETIETALDRERIIERNDFITKEIAAQVEDHIIDWLSENKSVEFRHLRWEDEEMTGFATREEVAAYDADMETRNTEIDRKPKKARIMMG